ncbi:MAG: radical SAM protein [Promethearchaeota archaeon]
MVKSYKIYVDSANWLCEPNLLGYSMINRYMIKNGHKIINDPSEADFIIINSCGFTKNHEDSSIVLFKEHYSKKEKKATMIMFGCLVKINKKLIDSLDVYPIDFDEGEKFDKIFYKKTKFEAIKPYCDTKELENQFFNKIIIQPSKIIPVLLSRLMLPFSKKLRMNYQKIIDDLIIIKNKILIEIGKGCASNCKYCVIKKTKGNIRSRQINDIIDDIEKLYDPTKELFLVADDCTCYGLDIKTNLIDLLYEIKKKFPDLLIDLDNINPDWLEKYPDEYIKLFSESNISYATIPVQSGSNRIIKDMNRNYDIKKIQNIIKKIKKVSPKTALYTHFIICYPNEKFIDFLKSIYCSMYFDLSIVFVYLEPKDSTSSGLSYHKSRFARAYRLTFFMLFQNFITFYKFLTFPNQK